MNIRVAFTTFIWALAAWTQTLDTQSTNYLVKFKSSRALMEAVQKTTLAVKAAGQKVEVLDDQWAKVSGNNVESSPLMKTANIEFVQPDYKLGFIEDYSNFDSEAKSEWLQTMQSDPVLFGRATKAKGDNPAIPMLTPVKEAKDPLIKRQWGMIDIGALQAWSQAKNNQTIIVAVIDSGVDYTHPDLTPNMWRNPGEVGKDAAGREKSSNGIDDDRNGYVDDVVGYDFAAKDAFPYDKSTPPWQLVLGGGGNPGHGTHCAGNIAARGNNGLGISGVAPHAQIMALRFITEKGSGETSAAIKAIRYAVDNGAKVLNNSWGSIGENTSEGPQNKALREAIQYAESKGVLFVAAAGNGFRGRGFDNDTANTPTFPASYPYSNIISVAAIDAKDNLGRFSNYGVKTVHIGAPGVKIFSTVVDAKYSDQPIPFLAVWEGTSMAAPHVAGAAALYWAHNPSKTMTEVKEAILKSAVKIPSLQNKTVSGGKLNLINLMKENWPL